MWIMVYKSHHTHAHMVKAKAIMASTRKVQRCPQLEELLLSSLPVVGVRLWAVDVCEFESVDRSNVSSRGIHASYNLFS